MFCTVHDYGHGGLNNDFLIKTHHPLAILYNDLSPLENHHISAAVSLLGEPDYAYHAVSRSCFSANWLWTVLFGGKSLLLYAQSRNLADDNALPVLLSACKLSCCGDRRQRDRQAGRQTHKQTDPQTNRQTDPQTDRQADISGC